MVEVLRIFRGSESWELGNRKSGDSGIIPWDIHDKIEVGVKFWVEGCLIDDLKV